MIAQNFADLQRCATNKFAIGIYLSQIQEGGGHFDIPFTGYNAVSNTNIRSKFGLGY